MLRKFFLGTYEENNVFPSQRDGGYKQPITSLIYSRTARRFGEFDQEINGFPLIRLKINRVIALKTCARKWTGK